MKIPQTDQAIAFCEYVLDGHNLTDSATMAGYSPDTAKSQGSRLRKEYEEYLVAETTANLKGGGAAAYAMLITLMKSAKQEAVKLKAATEILKFGGYSPVEKQEITVTQRSDEEIDAALSHLLGDKAKDVVRTLQ